MIVEGARRGEHALIVSFHETPRRLIDKAESAGLEPRSHVEAGRVRIRQAHRGETVLHPTIARMVFQELNRPAPPKQVRTTDPLSEREPEVLRFLTRNE